MLNPLHLFRLLTQEEVEVVLVGGVAMIVQGVTHDTNDIDLCYRRTVANMERLVLAILPLNPRLRVEGLTDAEARLLPWQLDVQALGSMETLTLMTDAGAVDLVAKLSGIGDYDAIRDEIVDVELDGITMSVLTLRAIIANKRAAARDKDIAALPRIEATLRLREAMTERETDASDHGDRESHSL
jgi:hypothetical protein